jgi:hypothetical protein
MRSGHAVPRGACTHTHTHTSTHLHTHTHTHTSRDRPHARRWRQCHGRLTKLNRLRSIRDGKKTKNPCKKRCRALRTYLVISLGGAGGGDRLVARSAVGGAERRFREAVRPARWTRSRRRCHSHPLRPHQLRDPNKSMSVGTKPRKRGAKTGRGGRRAGRRAALVVAAGGGRLSARHPHGGRAQGHSSALGPRV